MNKYIELPSLNLYLKYIKLSDDDFFLYKKIRNTLGVLKGDFKITSNAIIEHIKHSVISDSVKDRIITAIKSWIDYIDNRIRHTGVDYVRWVRKYPIIDKV